ncbi:hypothetical protein [Tautonia sociabilis]|uniref:Uncharacterized protein n=1 Tax=Tautonia sociabilis TaxID=2080755 RepID=A0A432MPZ8_9BACT|nr:hypothetical protein [Tautonia sociabilis]RUL89145.1 hypothetical protein TsocGM_03235 [Tautonia sociabilis]
MRRLLVLPLWAVIAAPVHAQSFAPAQSRAAEPPPPRLRVLAGDTQPGAAIGGNRPVLSNGMPVPVPLGLAGPGQPNGVLFARVPTSGATVSVSPSAIANGTRLYTYTNANGGLESVLYDPGTGATVVYDQSVSFSLQGSPGSIGPGGTPRTGDDSAAGFINNPSFSLQPGQAVPTSGIPLLNQAMPSYDFRGNLGLGTPATSGPATPSPFAGTPMQSVSSPSPGPSFSITPP